MEIKKRNLIGLVILTVCLTLMITCSYYEYKYDLSIGEKACNSWGYEGYSGTSYYSKQGDSKLYPDGFDCKHYVDGISITVTGKGEWGVSNQNE